MSRFTSDPKKNRQNVSGVNPPAVKPPPAAELSSGEMAFRIYVSRYILPSHEKRGLTEVEVAAIHKGASDPRFPDWHGEEGDQEWLRLQQAPLEDFKRHPNSTNLVAALDALFETRSVTARLLAFEAVFRSIEVQLWEVFDFGVLSLARQADADWRQRGGPLRSPKHGLSVRRADIQREKIWRRKAKAAGHNPLSPTDLQKIYELRAGGRLVRPRHVYDDLILEAYRKVKEQLSRRQSSRGSVVLAEMLAATFAYVFVPGHEQVCKAKRRVPVPLPDVIDTLRKRLRQRLKRHRRHLS